MTDRLDDSALSTITYMLCDGYGAEDIAVRLAEEKKCSAARLLPLVRKRIDKLMKQGVLDAIYEQDKGA